MFSLRHVKFKMFIGIQAEILKSSWIYESGDKERGLSQRYKSGPQCCNTVKGLRTAIAFGT